MHLLPYFRARAIRWCRLNFSPANPRCHGNEFWDKIGYNSTPVKDNCVLFAPIPIFSGPGYLMLSFKFLSWQPCCHGNEFWYKIHYNSVCVRDICKIFASTERLLPTEFFPERLSLPWQQNLGHNGLDLSLRKRYIKDLCIRWGDFEVNLFWYGQCACAIIRKHTYAPRKNHTLNIRKIIIIYQQKTFIYFLTLL